MSEIYMEVLCVTKPAANETTYMWRAASWKLFWWTVVTAASTPQI